MRQGVRSFVWSLSNREMCDLPLYNVKLSRHFSISSTTKTYIHENYWICFMLILTPEHILITFAFGEKSKGISNICTNTVVIQHLKNEVCPFSDHKSHIWSKMYVINLAVVLNEHVYLLKIKLYIQQIQFKEIFFLC